MTPSARPTCARGWPRSPGCPSAGRRACAAGWQLSEPLRTGGRARRHRALLPVPDAGRRLADRGRPVQGYMEKALREAKRNTSWVDQNAEWEQAVMDFVSGVYEHRELRRELDAFARDRRVRRGLRRAAHGCAQAHRAGRARHLPGRRAAAVRPRRPRQPAAGGLALEPDDAGPAGRRRPTRAGHPQAVADHPAARSAHPPPRRVRRRLRAVAAPETAVAFCAATRCWWRWPPGPDPPRACSRAPTGAGATCSTAMSASSRRHRGPGRAA